MAPQLTVFDPFQASEGAWRRALAYGCSECAWHIVLRDYRNRPGKASRLGAAGLHAHQTKTGHVAAWVQPGYY